MSLGLPCYIAAAVIFALLFFTTALDSSFLYCGLMLTAAGLALSGVRIPVNVSRQP
jgi:hypothetical protein